MSTQLWTLINYLAVSTSKSAGEQRKLQAEYLQVRGDLNATSSQDEFAKWARLRRQHDKLLDKLESTSMSCQFRMDTGILLTARLPYREDPRGREVQV